MADCALKSKVSHVTGTIATGIFADMTAIEPLLINGWEISFDMDFNSMRCVRKKSGALLSSHCGAGSDVKLAGVPLMNQA
jgi:hypothetical protein